MTPIDAAMSEIPVRRTAVHDRRRSHCGAREASPATGRVHLRRSVARLRRARRAARPHCGGPAARRRPRRRRGCHLRDEFDRIRAGVSRARCAPARPWRPLPQSTTPAALAAMIADTGARHLFLDAGVAGALEPARDAIAATLDRARRRRRPAMRRLLARRGRDARAPLRSLRSAVQHHLFVGHDGHAQGHRAAARDALDARPARRRATATSPTAVTLISTPLYSNTTLVSFLPALALGGTRGADGEVRRRPIPRARRSAIA